MLDLESAEIYCPYCGEPLEVFLEPEEIESEYIEDCQVCCRPIVFRRLLVGDESQLSVHSENE